MHVALVVKRGHEQSGIGRYARELQRGLEGLGCQVSLVYPTLPLPGRAVDLVRRLLKWDLAAFFNNYPLRARYPQADIYHFASQNLATLLLCCPPPGKTVVTVHDIFPYQFRDDAELGHYHHLLERLADRLAMAGLRRAGRIITDSTYTRDTLFEYLQLDLSLIKVVAIGMHPESQATPSVEN